MKTSVRSVLYALLVLLLVIDFYLIFNAGSPYSLLRHIVSDPSWDVAVTVGCSLLIAAISLFMMRESSRSSVSSLLEANREHIAHLRSQGRSYEEIAESFTAQLPLKRAFSRKLIYRKALRTLKRMKP